ncbi:MAG: phosphoenolpyruvate hydrolase family protein, partial [Lacipirellulaceae bacterium]
SIGAQTALTLEMCLPRIQEIAEAARTVREDVIVLCHGGPIAQPSDAQYVIENLDIVDGFYGASSVERLPTEVAITAQVEEFTRIRRKR